MKIYSDNVMTDISVLYPWLAFIVKVINEMYCQMLFNKKKKMIQVIYEEHHV